MGKAAGTAESSHLKTTSKEGLEMSSTFKLAKFLVTCSLQHYPEWEQDSNTGDHHSTSNKFSYKIILRANEMAAVQLKFNPQDPHDSSRKLTLSSCVLISTHMLWHA